MKIFTPIISTFIALVSITTPASAAKIKVASKAPTPGSDFHAYYHTPEGVTFSGLGKNLEFDGDYAFAPAGKWLSTSAEIDVDNASAAYSWTIPTGFNSDGAPTTETTEQSQISFRVKENGLCPAPKLVADYKGKSAEYQMANDGIQFGSYGTWQNFAVNYQLNQTVMLDQANDIIATNDPSAKAILDMIYTGSIYSDINILGFSESFYDCGAFWLEAVNAVLYSKQELKADDIAVKVFKRVQTSVSEDEIAQLKTTEVIALGENRYFVTFNCDKPAYITTAMQVVVLPAEGSKVRFSPVIPVQKSYHPSNMGTCAFYGDFKLAGMQVKKQYLDFFGTTTTDENDKPIGFVNNWAIGIKGSYDKPDSGISEIVSDNAETVADDAPVYSITGQLVGVKADIDRLPAGIYICSGKKYLIR